MFVLPQSVVVPIILEWIQVTELSALDVGVSAVPLRQRFLSILNGKILLNESSRKATPEFIHWLLKHSLALANFIIDSHVAERLKLLPLNFVQFTAKLRSIEIDWGKNWKKNSWLINFVLYTPMLEQLSLCRCRISDIQELLGGFLSFKTLQKMKIIDLVEYHLSVEELSVLTEFVRRCRLLKELWLEKLRLTGSWISLEAEVWKPHSTMTIHLKDCRIDHGLPPALQSITSYICTSDSVYYERLAMLMKSPPAAMTLTALELHCCSRVEETLMAALPRLPNLIRLELVACCITKRLVGAIAQCDFVPNLLTLNLGDHHAPHASQSVDDDSIAQLSERCRALTSLDLGSMSLLSAKCLTRIILQCNKVTALNLSGVANMELKDSELLEILAPLRSTLRRMSLFTQFKLTNLAVASLLHDYPLLDTLCLSSTHVTMGGFNNTYCSIRCRLTLLHLSSNVVLDRESINTLLSTVFPRCKIVSKYGTVVRPVVTLPEKRSTRCNSWMAKTVKTPLQSYLNVAHLDVKTICFSIAIVVFASVVCVVLMHFSNNKT